MVPEDRFQPELIGNAELAQQRFAADRMRADQAPLTVIEPLTLHMHCVLKLEHADVHRKRG